jgi:2'-5' RNA ligase
MQTEFAFNIASEPRRRPRKPERLFFCLFPDPATAARVVRFREGFTSERRLAGSRLEAERLHVSLHHVGDYVRLKSKHVYAAQLAGRAVAMPPFDVEFRMAKSFEAAPGRTGRPLVLMGEGGGLFQLRKTLGDAMGARGLSTVEPFAPHMTLLYGPDAVPVQEIAPIRFTADAFALVHSEVGLSRYHLLDRWPLRG